MENGIYCLFNVLSCRFGDVMAFATDAYALKRLNDMLNDGKLANKTELVLYKIGALNMATGENIPCIPTPIPWDSNDPIEKELK